MSMQHNTETSLTNWNSYILHPRYIFNIYSPCICLWCLVDGHPWHYYYRVHELKMEKCEENPSFRHRKQNKSTCRHPSHSVGVVAAPKKPLNCADKSGLTAVMTRHILFVSWARESLCRNAGASWQTDVTTCSHLAGGGNQRWNQDLKSLEKLNKCSVSLSCTGSSAKSQRWA